MPGAALRIMSGARRIQFIGTSSQLVRGHLGIGALISIASGGKTRRQGCGRTFLATHYPTSTHYDTYYPMERDHCCSYAYDSPIWSNDCRNYRALIEKISQVGRSRFISEVLQSIAGHSRRCFLPGTRYPYEVGTPPACPPTTFCAHAACMVRTCSIPMIESRSIACYCDYAPRS
jgi:hypothetical protein